MLTYWLHGALALLPVAGIARRAPRPRSQPSDALRAAPDSLLRALETSAALREARRPQPMAHEPAVASALVRVGQEVIAALSSTHFLNRLCTITAEVLGCEMSHTLMLLPDEDVFVPIASEDDTPERREALRLVRVPRAMIGDVLTALDRGDVAQVDAIPEVFAPQVPGLADYQSLCIALRRGTDIIGLQTAQRARTGAPFGEAEIAIAGGIAQLASLALNHARTVEELAQANRIKSDFVATMSHELRTPLHVILGYADLLLSGEFGDLNERQAETMDRLLNRARELHELIVSTLDVSRIDSGRAILHVEEVELPQLLAAVEAESQRWLARGEPSFSMSVAPDVPRLCTDPTKLKVVLKNLVSNAFKFTERGRVALRAEMRGGDVAISVSDTGIGIAPDVVAGLFQPFRQGDPSPSRRYAGVGLGLYIVRRLLEILGGDVSVESEVGRGSVFTVTIPVEARQARGLTDATTQTAASAVAFPATNTPNTPS